MIENFLIILALNWSVVTILWLATLKIQRADFIDIYWGPSFFLSGLLLLLLEKNFTSSSYMLLLLVGIWGFRLAFYLLARNLNKDEDRRYVKIRTHRGNFGLYLTAYLIQVILIGIVSLPIQLLIAQTESNNWNLISLIGVIIAISGIVIESIADLQMSKFKSFANNERKLMDKGLWQFSRHPNYFGDSLFWWGIFIFTYSHTSNFIIILSPILMTYFLIKVSGVDLLESQIKHKKEGYEDYIKSTSSFIFMLKKNKK